MTAEDDFEERDTADRGRCARLVRVSSAAGDEAEAPSSAGASAEIFEHLGWRWKRCNAKTRGNAVYCADCERNSVEVKVAPLIVSSLRFSGQGAERYDLHQDQLLAEHGRHVRWYVDGREDDPRPPGKPKKGITEREEIIDAELAEVEYVALSPEEFRVMQADGRWAAIQASAPQPGTRAWQHYRARLAGRAQNVNTAAQAKLWGVSEQTILDWRKTWGNSPMGREADLTPATKADVDTLLERLDQIHGDVRMTLGVVLEAFEDNPQSAAVVAAKIDMLVDDVLGDRTLAD